MRPGARDELEDAEEARGAKSGIGVIPGEFKRILVLFGLVQTRARRKICEAVEGWDSLGTEHIYIYIHFDTFFKDRVLDTTGHGKNPMFDYNRKSTLTFFLSSNFHRDNLQQRAGSIRPWQRSSKTLRRVRDDRIVGGFEWPERRRDAALVKTHPKFALQALKESFFVCLEEGSWFSYFFESLQSQDRTEIYEKEPVHPGAHKVQTCKKYREVRILVVHGIQVVGLSQNETNKNYI